MTTDAPARTKTTYVILALSAPEVTDADVTVQPEVWTVAQRMAVATSAEAAVRSFVEKNEVAGMYLTIPPRSWKPTTVKVEQQTIVKVG